MIDVLSEVSHEVKNNEEDFELYRRLRRDGRSFLSASELAGPPAPFGLANGIRGNPSWTLDKWKFMPMMNRILHSEPHQQRYVFMEAYSFLL